MFAKIIIMYSKCILSSTYYNIYSEYAGFLLGQKLLAIEKSEFYQKYQ